MRRRFLKRKAPSTLALARELIAAVDCGGIPLNPARVNALARDLGLEVSVHAPVEQTIERLRAWLQRDDAYHAAEPSNRHGRLGGA